MGGNRLGRPLSGTGSARPGRQFRSQRAVIKGCNDSGSIVVKSEVIDQHKAVDGQLSSRLSSAAINAKWEITFYKPTSRYQSSANFLEARFGIPYDYP